MTDLVQVEEFTGTDDANHPIKGVIVNIKQLLTYLFHMYGAHV
jgi:hypothetical protein